MARAGYRPVMEVCGGTELAGSYMACTLLQPQCPSTFSLPAFGALRSRALSYCLGCRVGSYMAGTLLQPWCSVPLACPPLVYTPFRAAHL